MNVFTSSVEAKSNWLCAQKGPLSGRWTEWNNLV